jgi:Autographiviridae endonuclease VII
MLITKRCTKCGEVKPLDAFCRQKGGRFGRHPRCRECRSVQEKERYWANRDQILAKQRSSSARKAYRRQAWRWKKYGMSREEYEARVASQGGLCALGHIPAGGVLVIDHDHVSGDVRGLLCKLCNAAIGMLEEDVDRLRRAIAYLQGEVPEWPIGTPC